MSVTLVNLLSPVQVTRSEAGDKVNEIYLYKAFPDIRIIYAIMSIMCLAELDNIIPIQDHLEIDLIISATEPFSAYSITMKISSTPTKEASNLQIK